MSNRSDRKTIQTNQVRLKKKNLMKKNKDKWTNIFRYFRCLSIFSRKKQRNSVKPILKTPNYVN